MKVKTELGKLTPRQRTAICWPCDMGKNHAHPRYHKRTGGWQSILTFDMFAPAPHDDDCARKRNVDEPCDCGSVRKAMWHARATPYPQRPLADWSVRDQSDIKRVLNGMLRGVGQGGVEVQKGGESPSISIHFYREATISEVGQCVRGARIKR